MSGANGNGAALMSRTARRPRFVVAVTRGTLTGGDIPHRREQGSAAVCDSWYGFRVVANYRSENRRGSADGAMRRGLPGAIEAAELHAARLNEAL